MSITIMDQMDATKKNCVTGGSSFDDTDERVTFDRR